jgi:hypothetical protein
MFLLFGCRNFPRIDTTCEDYLLRARLSGLIVVCFGRFWVLQPRLRYSPGLALTTRLNALLNAASDS